MNEEQIKRKITNTKDYCCLSPIASVWADAQLQEYKEKIRAEERAKTIEECKKLVGRILKAYRDEYHFGVTFNGMCDNILNNIEQLKEQK